MNLQDYNKWYACEHHERRATLPWWVTPAAFVAYCALRIVAGAWDVYTWIRKSDPIELMVALWAATCAALFIAGIIASFV